MYQKTLLDTSRETETLVHNWRECRMVPPLWKKVWRFLKNLKTELPYGPATLILGIYPKELEKNVL